MFLSFDKTLSGCEIKNIAAAAPPAFCYNSWPCFDSSACSRNAGSLLSRATTGNVNPRERLSFAVLRYSARRGAGGPHQTVAGPFTKLDRPLRNETPERIGASWDYSNSPNSNQAQLSGTIRTLATQLAR